MWTYETVQYRENHSKAKYGGTYASRLGSWKGCEQLCTLHPRMKIHRPTGDVDSQSGPQCGVTCRGTWNTPLPYPVSLAMSWARAAHSGWRGVASRGTWYTLLSGTIRSSLSMDTCVGPLHTGPSSVSVPSLTSWHVTWRDVPWHVSFCRWSKAILPTVFFRLSLQRR